MKRLLAFFLLIVAAGVSAADYLAESPGAGFPLADEKGVAPIVVEDTASPGVIRAVNSVREDIFQVTQQRPEIHAALPRASAVILVAEIGKSALLEQLVSSGKLDLGEVEGRWDGYLIQHIDTPFEDVDEAWVIVGANRRGAMYGLYDLSETIGVSPWYWWADVPVMQKKSVYLASGTRVLESPKVKYRGIFLNDEAPALTNWVHEKYGGYNASFYENVFELLLRLKANFLWPAMWNNAFADDDPQNPLLAHEMGIVMSNSHHEPMMRADKEWNRYGEGAWEYSTNPENLYKFWQEGAERHKALESIFTLGMRGQEDTPMSEGQNVELLETIVADQRKILDETFDKPLSEVPQVWALYKEVQGFYERGMRVPEDVTLLWTDDNFGNIRRLPIAEERGRKGGAGVYYHFDYVGDPRSYRWINTVPLGKVYEQMSMAWEYGAREIWITNVGDLKPMELPIDFFLTMAWDPEAFDGQTATQFTREWAAQQFGEAHADSVAALLNTYTLHNGRRKPEAVTPDTYSLYHYNEAARISTWLEEAAQQAVALQQTLPEKFQSAFFQLVGYPLWATQTMYELNYAQALNARDADQDRATTNDTAAQVKYWFNRDKQLAEQYHSLKDGRWNHMMSQPHIGFVHWRNPPANLPPVTRHKALATPAVADMGVSTQNQPIYWPASEWQKQSLALETFTPYGASQRTITVYNRQAKPFDFTAEARDDWVRLSDTAGTVAQQHDLDVSIDWDSLPSGVHESSVYITGTGWGGARVHVKAVKTNSNPQGYVETDGVIAVNASSAEIDGNQPHVKWETLSLHGRTGTAVRSFISADGEVPERLAERPVLTYPLYFTSTGTFDVIIDISPSQQFFPNHKLAFWMVMDGGEPQRIDGVGDYKYWEKEVLDNVRQLKTSVTITDPGTHILKLYLEDTGVVLQKITIDTGGLQESYLGPPESPFVQKRNE
ncbi:glycosyl hydrolase 115 family protein [Alteromonas sp. H39]|uniref:glycosyl hydrolase 115 family protein n=1 Tax=Alteromonas sp. H39 TaxID=3389876 RepID=UPI0039E02EB0